MAGISVNESPRGRRAVDHALPLVPFIDFMVCLIAFLMVTAAWTQMSRLEAAGKLPFPAGEPVPDARPDLHVLATSGGFDLRWQSGSLVLETQHVPRTELRRGDDRSYPALKVALQRAWLGQVTERAGSGRTRAVLHVPNDVPFAEVAGMLDALHAPRRGDRSAFEVALAPN